MIGRLDDLLLNSGHQLKLSVSLTFLTICLFGVACNSRDTVESVSSGNSASSASAININTASADELTRIPHIGEKLAAKIVDHREINGPFRRVEHLMLIQGISDQRFRKIRPLVRVE